MADSSSARTLDDRHERVFEGQRIAFFGRLTGMPRREAALLVRQAGGEVVDRAGQPTVVVVGDEYANWESAVNFDEATRRHLTAAQAASEVVCLGESQFWQELGLVGDCEVRRLYTPAMLAELLEVPAAAIRRWEARGVLCPVRRVRRLSYFDFREVAVAQRLADLNRAGCSIREIDRLLNRLEALFPEVTRPLAELPLVVEGRQLLLRRGDELTEPGGQLLFDFEAPDETVPRSIPVGPERLAEGVEQALSLADRPPGDASAEAPLGAAEADAMTLGNLAERLEREAVEWEQEGDFARAAEAYRALLMSNGPTAEIQFALADVLYRGGDLPAARERYYCALEIDEEFVEARANLGCVLAETHELELAAATFQGALAFHSDFADVHFHLANVLDQLGREEEAAMHFRTFLAQAPESPWAEAARNRLLRDESPLAAENRADSPSVSFLGPGS
jgi:tetratricopeptide (TPR) repeat protein